MLNPSPVFVQPDRAACGIRSPAPPGIVTAVMIAVLTARPHSNVWFPVEFGLQSRDGSAIADYLISGYSCDILPLLLV